MWLVGFPGGSEGKESACSVGDPGSIPGLGRSPGEGNGNPLQYSCLENSMDRGAWWAPVRGVALTYCLQRFCAQGWTLGCQCIPLPCTVCVLHIVPSSIAWPVSLSSFAYVRYANTV